jgi:hypothetical protein
MNLKNLTAKEREIFDTISSEAISVVKDNAEGVEFVRVNLYEGALEELLTRGETEKEIVGAHFFTNFQSDDIDKENQIEIGNFEQDKMEWVEGDGTWEDTERGENWLKDMEKSMDEEIFNAIINQRETKSRKTLSNPA